MNELFDSAGRRISIGNKIGTGGEGTVYDVPSLGNEIVAKVYHEKISSEKQAKLLLMVKAGNESLRKIATWPLETLHKTNGREICGFLMPKIINGQPIHHLYNPNHRKKSFPDKDWAFLVNSARNIASAFETIHSNGHIIGDVNPNLVYIAENSIVKLIDCDSFQIFAEGKFYLCEVGVPHFTPPELQVYSSFRGIRRTKNHDNFGLSLLIFHILLMGRHPFSGIYSGIGDMPLEKSIEQFRYAFGNFALNKKMAPPPNSVTPAILPAGINQLFERAFSEQGIQSENRPSAREWVMGLDLLKSQLRSCGQESMHKYFGGLSSCPWCKHENNSKIYFFLLHGTSINNFNLTQIWGRIIAVNSPGPAPSINWSSIKVIPKALPFEVIISRIFKIVLPILIVIVGFSIGSVWSLVSIFIGIIAYFSNNAGSAEFQNRLNQVNKYKQSWNVTLNQWQSDAGDTKFKTKYKELSDLRLEYENLANQMNVERQKLQDNVRENQLQKFLDGQYIDNHSISGIGPSRKATLSSFGVETAADVTWNQIINIPGFGSTFTRELVDWRKSLERRFVFDPSKGVNPADIAALNQRFSHRRKQIEVSLLAGPEQLINIRDSVLEYRKFFPMVQQAAQQLAQAEADLSLLK